MKYQHLSQLHLLARPVVLHTSQAGFFVRRPLFLQGAAGDFAWQARPGLARCGMARRGEAGRGKAGVERHGAARLGVARLGTAGAAGRGAARRGEAGPGKARQARQKVANRWGDIHTTEPIDAANAATQGDCKW